MKENNDIKKIYLYLGIFISIIFIGATYAFFTAEMSSETTTTIRADAGIMNITYDGGENIELSGIYPRDEVWATKDITVTGNNTTDAEMYYKLTLMVKSNSFSTTDPLQCELISTNTSNNGEVIPNVSKTNITSAATVLGTGHFVKANNAVHTYQLKIYYPRTEESQNNSQSASFSAYVTIESTTKPKKSNAEMQQRGAIKNKVFKTDEPGTLKVQLVCENSEQRAGGIIPMAYCLNYEMRGVSYVIDNSTDKYVMEDGDWNDSGKPTMGNPGGDAESIDVDITYDLIKSYNGEIPFDYLVRATLHPTLPVAQVGQKYWIRLYFIDSSNNKYLVDWFHRGNDGTLPKSDGTGGVDGSEIDETEEAALAACQYSDCEI